MRKYVTLFVLLSISSFIHAQESKLFDSLQKKMSLAYSFGNYRQAADLAIQSLAIARKDLGETHIEVGNQYCNLGLFLKSLNKFDSAAWCYDEAESFFRKNNYTLHQDYISIPINKGTLASTLGKYDSAVYYMNLASSACENIKGCNNSTNHATILNNLGNIFMRLNRDKDAEKALLRADSMSISLKQDEQFLGMAIRNSLATVYTNLAEYEKALAYLQRIEPLYVKKLGASNINTIITHSNIFLCYYKMGDRKRGDSLGPIIMERVEKLKDKSPVFQFLNNYALMLTSIGKLEEADRVYNILLPVMDKVFGEDHPQTRFVQNNHIILLLELGQFERMYATSKRLKEKPGSDSTNKFIQAMIDGNYLSSLLGLDSLDAVIREGNSMLARYEGDSSINIREAVQSIYMNLTVAHQHKRQPQQALHTLNRALALNGGKLTYQRVFSLQHKAILLASLKKYDEAVDIIEEALKAAKDRGLEQHYIYRKLLFNKTAVLNMSGRIESASLVAQQLLSIHRQQLLSLLDYLTASERELFVNNMLDDLNYLLDFYLYAERKLPAKYTEQFLDVLLFREGILLKTNTAARKALLQSNDQVLIAKHQELQQLRTKWLQQLQLPAEQQRNVNELAKEILTLEKDIQASAKGLTEKPVTWKSISEGLKTGEAYIHYYQSGNFMDSSTGFVTSDRECYAVLLRKNAKPVLVRIDPGNTLNKYFRNSSATTKIHVARLYTRTHQDGAISLYKLLWEPLEKYLGGIKSIYLRTNGDINRISFAAIPTPGTGIIADKYIIRRLITLSDSSFNWETRPGNMKNILLIGDVNFNSNKTSDQRSNNNHQWEALPATKEEIATIRQMFSQKNYTCSLLVDSLATESAIKDQVNKLQPGIIHIATHGFFTRKIPKVESTGKMVEKGLFAYSDLGYMQSGLVMAGANNYQKQSLLGEDGVLNAYEVQGMNFGNTDLVVLSACESALGNIDRQEGVYGLQRAFKIAGAKYQVLSLWRIPDAETREMMNAFYQQLADQKTYEEAFNYAQGMMKSKYDPYYWAGFVLLK